MCDHCTIGRNGIFNRHYSGQIVEMCRDDIALDPDVFRAITKELIQKSLLGKVVVVMNMAGRRTVFGCRCESLRDKIQKLQEFETLIRSSFVKIDEDIEKYDESHALILDEKPKKRRKKKRGRRKQKKKTAIAVNTKDMTAWEAHIRTIV